MIEARASRSTTTRLRGYTADSPAPGAVTNSRWIGYAGSARDGTCTNAPSAIWPVFQATNGVASSATWRPRCFSRAGSEPSACARLPARIPAPVATDDNSALYRPFTNTSRGHSACPNMKGVRASRETVASGAAPNVAEAIGEMGVNRHSSSFDLGRPSSAKRCSPCCRSATSHAGSVVSIRSATAVMRWPPCRPGPRSTRSRAPRARAPVPCRPTSRSARPPAHARSRARCS